MSALARRPHRRGGALVAPALLLLARLAIVSAVRVAFIADTGIGNDNPGGYWTDFYGNRQAPRYDVGGVPCVNFKGEPCRQYSRARDVIAAVRDNGADLVVHAGDLDYESSPRMWRRFVDETIRGAGMDYLAVKGNHDADGWDGVRWLWNGDPDGYAAQLRPTLPAGADCRGEYGTAMVCDYRGVTLVLSDVGVDAAGESANARQYEHIDRALRESSNPWKVCVWHMNMEDMQVSYKGDSVGWGAFEICRRRGAFVVNGHAHSYARTKEMARYGRKVYGHTKKELVVSHPGIDRVYLSSGENGTNGVAVVGFGGYKNEPQLRGGDHWAKIYSSECLSGDDACERAPEARMFGALMCDFSDARPGAEAECWTVTTVEKDASRAEKRRAYRNPADRFFLVVGARPERSSEVYLNAAKPRARRAFDGDLKRADPDCVDVQPPAYDCARQREWGKCDSWFMTDGGYCEKTCGRCVDLYPGGLRDYDDYADADANADADPPEADAIGDDPMDDVDFKALADDVLRSIGGD